MKKLIIILLLVLTPVFFGACVIGMNVYSHDEYSGYYINKSSYNVYIQEFYFSDYSDSKNKVFYDSGMIVEKDKTADGAPTHNNYLEKILFIDADNRKILRTISAGEYFTILELYNYDVRKSKEGDEIHYFTYHFYITDEFLKY